MEEKAHWINESKVFVEQPLASPGSADQRQNWSKKIKYDIEWRDCLRYIVCVQCRCSRRVLPESVNPIQSNQIQLNPIQSISFLYAIGRVHMKSPKKKVNVKKLKFLCLNIIENRATGHKSTFLASLLLLSGPYWPCWVWANKCPFS